jgi:ABC-2 type transport system ATP-binding protein
VQPGQVLGLVGHNGAGKTTTLRAIAGILAPSSGRIEVAGHDLQAEPLQAKRRLGYIPDDPQLFDELTVDEHLQFVAAAYQLAGYRERAEQLIHFFQLGPKRHTPAEALSRGMRQKLAVCCAYLPEPSAILFDEPLTGLDPVAIRRLKDSIRERAADGAAVIVSSHLLAMVESVCTHFMFLQQGRTTFYGTRDELADAFADVGKDASLEDIFFESIEQCAVEA